MTAAIAPTRRGHPVPPNERFKLLVECVKDYAILILDETGHVSSWNLGAERLNGYSEQEIIGQHFSRFYIPEDIASRKPQRELETATAVGRVEDEGWRLRKDGTRFWANVVITALRDEAGRLCGFGKVVRDMTERKLAERRFHALLELAPDAMVIVNPEGDILIVNSQAEKLFGYSRDEILGTKVWLLLAPQYRDPHPSSDNFFTLPQVRATRGRLELRVRRKVGTEFPAEISFSPLDMEGERLISAAFRDISERVEEVERNERIKDDLVSTVSHELRTPLTAISGAMALLLAKHDNGLPEASTRLLKIAHGNCQRLVRLVNDILAIDKAESGAVVYVLKTLDLRAIAEQTIEANRELAESAGVSIRLDAPPGPCELNADSDRIIQVLTNLISNAVRFSPAGKEVVVCLAKRDGAVHISVRDHGSGIPEGFKPRIFSKFAQADGPDLRSKGGTGLGLSIVKQIVTMLGGSVSFSDAPGGGTIFFVELPDRPVSLPAPERSEVA
jgi:PAS domain S-box-containing protein